jgi:hypothetical protein
MLVIKHVFVVLYYIVEMYGGAVMVVIKLLLLLLVTVACGRASCISKCAYKYIRT